MINRVLLAVLTVILAASSFAQSPADAEKAQSLMERGAVLLDQKKPDLAEPLLRQFGANF